MLSSTALLTMLLLGRKRKGSVDGTASDGATSQRKKQPRVSFTAEQKEALRRTYEADPYPTQPSIDRLASELGIGPRTVINWFHNHRMRYAKQQYAATGIWSVTGAATAIAKREPSDLDPSSQSCSEDIWDMSPATADTPLSTTPSTPATDLPPMSFTTNGGAEDLSASVGTVASPGMGCGANRRKNTRPQRLGTSEDDSKAVMTLPAKCSAGDKDELCNSVDQLPTVMAS